MSNFIPTICRACIHKRYCKQDYTLLYEHFEKLGKGAFGFAVPEKCPLLIKNKKKPWSVS